MIITTSADSVDIESYRERGKETGELKLDADSVDINFSNAATPSIPDNLHTALETRDLLLCCFHLLFNPLLCIFFAFPMMNSPLKICKVSLTTLVLI